MKKQQWHYREVQKSPKKEMVQTSKGKSKKETKEKAKNQYLKDINLILTIQLLASDPAFLSAKIEEHAMQVLRLKQ